MLSFNDLEEDKDLKYGIFLINNLSVFQGNNFNPLNLIKAVNYFYTLEADKVFQCLLVYSKLLEKIQREEMIDFNIFKAVDKVMMLARILFVPKENKKLPELRIGCFNIEPKNKSLFPLFPLHIYKDIPLLLIHSRIMFGDLTSPEIYTELCMEHGKLRDSPLYPSNPINTIDNWLKTDIFSNFSLGAWAFKINQDHELRRTLYLQALRTISNVYPLNEDDEAKLRGYCSMEEARQIWQKHKQVLAQFKIVWNPIVNDFELI